ncbi:hypothetical protein [Massilia sp. TWR1-2-2]|uniref:hypothetical protein n=1 Tax=Massilia sp. TWR1-2-2 TaxID=2804584 RepID=UPI003CF6A2CF
MWPATPAGLFNTPDAQFLELKDDIKNEGRPPDRQFVIDDLDEDVIQKWWDKFQKTNRKFAALGQNCAETVSEALDAGGGRFPAVKGGGFPFQLLFWTPSNVADYADAINKGIEAKKRMKKFQRFKP